MSRSKQELIAALSYPGGALPEDALREAIERYGEIRPELHAALRLAPDEIRDREANGIYMLQFYAMYLAAQRRDADAFPLIRDFFAEHGEAACEVTGDLVTEHLHRILASVCADDPEALRDAVALPGLDPWARIAFFEALATLHIEGMLERERLVAWFRDWLEGDALNDIERNLLVHVCCDLALAELQPMLLAMLENGRLEADELEMDAAKIEQAMQRASMPEDLRVRYALVDDAVEELRFWVRDSSAGTLLPLFEPEELPGMLMLLKDINRHREEGTMGLPFLHGYLFGIALTPDLLSIGEWWPHLLGDEEPVIESEKDLKAQLTALMMAYNRLNNQRLEGTLRCPFTPGNEPDATWIDAAREWCAGLARAAKLRPDLWWDMARLERDGGDEVGEINLAMIMVMALAEPEFANRVLRDIGKTPNEEERARMHADFLLRLPDAIETLIARMNAQDAARLAPARGHKVGRNAPCPCGSGKKFKKCCGAPGRRLH